LRESLGGRALGGRLCGKERRRPKMCRVRVYFIEKNSPLHLRSNFDIGFLVGLYLGLNVIGFNLKVNSNL